MVDERKRGTEEERKSLKSLSEECTRRTKKSRPQATKKLNCICTKPQDAPGTGGSGHQLAVVAYRDGQLYCMCTESYDGPAAGADGHQLAVVAYRNGQLYCMCAKP